MAAASAARRLADGFQFLTLMQPHFLVHQGFPGLLLIGQIARNLSKTDMLARRIEDGGYDYAGRNGVSYFWAELSAWRTTPLKFQQFRLRQCSRVFVRAPA